MLARRRRASRRSDGLNARLVTPAVQQCIVEEHCVSADCWRAGVAPLGEAMTSTRASRLYAVEQCIIGHDEPQRRPQPDSRTHARNTPTTRNGRAAARPSRRKALGVAGSRAQGLCA
jgi:hypothetical protein